MGVVTNEPSMEDILSSIKRIIADGSDRTGAAPRSSRRRTASRDESDDMDIEVEEQDSAILELTDMVEESTPAEDPAPTPEPAVTLARKGGAKAAAQPEPAAAPPVSAEEQILSDVSAQAARQSLSQLSSLLVRPQEGEANTIEGLVREMLRPMLKDWLEARLPELVESMVKKEIDRIVGRLG
ncbi:MAG TPA: DUF2497 domain-containing protein [Sphingobium sp.]